MRRATTLRRLLAALVPCGCYSAPETVMQADATSESSGSGTTVAATGDTSNSTTEGDSSSGGTAPSESSESSGAADSSSGDATSESTGGPTSCFESDNAFGEPTPLEAVNSDAVENGVALSPDEITIYVSSDRAGTAELDLYVAVRDAIDTEFGVLTPIAPLNTPTGEGRPTLTADGLTLYASQGFTDIVGDNEILVATRASLATEFSALSPVGFINSAANDNSPSISPDGETLYFASQAMGEAGSWAIVRSELQPNDTFSVPEVLGELETAAAENSPVISADGLALYYSSNAAGSYDIMVTTRSSVADGFGRPAPIDEVNSEVEDRPSWVSPDGCRLYLISDRDGNADIFVAERAP